MLHTSTCFVRYTDVVIDGVEHGNPRWRRADEKLLGTSNSHLQGQRDADETGSTGNHRCESGLLTVWKGLNSEEE